VKDGHLKAEPSESQTLSRLVATPTVALTEDYDRRAIEERGRVVVAVEGSLEGTATRGD